MELWIRSQNREILLQTNFLYIIDSISKSKKDLCFIKTKNCILGTYKTKERALEVLDEIQDMLRFFKAEGFSAEGLISIENNLAIYQMPKE